MVQLEQGASASPNRDARHDHPDERPSPAPCVALGVKYGITSTILI